MTNQSHEEELTQTPGLLFIISGFVYVDSLAGKLVDAVSDATSVKHSAKTVSGKFSYCLSTHMD